MILSFRCCGKELHFCVLSKEITLRRYGHIIIVDFMPKIYLKLQTKIVIIKHCVYKNIEYIKSKKMHKWSCSQRIYVQLNIDYDFNVFTDIPRRKLYSHSV